MKTPKTLVVFAFPTLVGCTRIWPDSQLHVESADPWDRPQVVGVLGNKEFVLNLADAGAPQAL